MKTRGLSLLLCLALLAGILSAGLALPAAAATADPPHEHVFTEEFNYSNEKGHGRICRACGDFATLKDFEPHVPGPAATETEPQVCTECGRILAWATGETFEDADLGFSVQPFVKSAETTGNTAMICFGCSHADKLTGWSLWRDEHGDHWKKMASLRRRATRTGFMRSISRRCSTMRLRRNGTWSAWSTSPTATPWRWSP